MVLDLITIVEYLVRWSIKRLMIGLLFDLDWRWRDGDWNFGV